MGVTAYLRRGLFAAERWVYYRLLRGKKETRVRRFWEVMRPVAGERVLDVGAGAGDFWVAFGGDDGLATGALRMTAVDLKPVGEYGVFQWRVVADARCLPFRAGAFDVVFSNSVIEHVGDESQQQLMAREIERVGRRYFVQVPARWFPVEAHYFIPFLSYLPVRWQVALTRRVFGIVEPIYLPTYSVVRRLFPLAMIERERLWGLTKSYYIFKGHSA